MMAPNFANLTKLEKECNFRSRYSSFSILNKYQELQLIISTYPKHSLYYVHRE